MAYTIGSFDTNHKAMIHDAEFDFYGQKMASCSSDGTIHIFEIAEDKQTQLCEIDAHDGPVWQIVWGHPKFGSILASCGFDRKVRIWKEIKQGTWDKVYEFNHFEASVNSISFGAWEYGVCLCAGCSDGKITIMERSREDEWSYEEFEAHKVGVNAVDWAPATFPSLLHEPTGEAGRLPPNRFVSGGSDKAVKVWTKNAVGGGWEEELLGEGHSDWVRDVAWSSNLGLPYDTIATCSEDMTVIIWKKISTKQWHHTVLKKFNVPVWKVSWSPTGNMLAVSTGENIVYVYKEMAEDKWDQITTVNENGVTENYGGLNVSPS